MFYKKKKRFIAPRLGEVVEKTIEVSREIAVAASRETYLASGDYEEMKVSFKDGLKGVWCGEAATYAKYFFEKQKWRVVFISFGLREHWNHASLLVKSEIGWLVVDPYLGNVWGVDFASAIRGIRAGRIPFIINFGVERDVYFMEYPTEHSESWTIGRHSSKPIRCRGEKPFICTLRHDYLDYATRYHESKDFLDYLEQQGLPRDLSSALVLPYAIVSELGYREVRNVDEVLGLVYRD